MSLLPFARRPGTDLTSKAILTNTKVIQIIENGLSLSPNEYVPEVNEWSNGQRSDVVLRPKCPTLPPLIIEVQNTINTAFMLKAIDYSRAAEKKFGVLPLVLVFNTSTITRTVKTLLTQSNVEGCKKYPSTPWAEYCLIFSMTHWEPMTPDQHTIKPFTALGLFLAEGARSLSLSIYQDDATIQQLFSIANEIFTTDTINSSNLEQKYGDLLEEVSLFTRNLLTKLTKSEEQRDVIKYVADYQKTIQKRRHPEEDPEEEAIGISKCRKVVYSDDEKKFVKEYMVGKEIKNWDRCLADGKEKGLFKSANRTVKGLKSLFDRMKK